MLYIAVTYTLKADKAAEFVAEIEASGAADMVRAEDGCYRYEYFCPASDTVLLMEAWESADKQKVHLTQPHMKTIGAIKEKYCEAVKVDMFPQGKYRHFKGNEYELLYLANHSETLEPVVVYQALYGARGIWVRPAGMWNESVEHEGKTVSRFAFCE